jgi:hypothetical protein
MRLTLRKFQFLPVYFLWEAYAPTEPNAGDKDETGFSIAARAFDKCHGTFPAIAQYY